MHLLEWAFAEDVPHAEKLVLVWLAWRANADGLGLMDRAALAKATGYKPRSIQRLLKSLRDSMLLAETGRGYWYRIGPLHTRGLAKQIAELPEDMRPVPPGLYGGGPITTPLAIDAEDIAQTVGDYLVDQLANVEARLGQRLDRLSMFPVEHDAQPEPPPPDPVKENPLYQELLNLGKPESVAYALSEADLNIEDDLALAGTQPPAATSEDYEDSLDGRLQRIADILEGAASTGGQGLRDTWAALEAEENKHSVKGERAAFLNLYPAIVSAAKANVGRMTLAQFIDPQRAARGAAPWDTENSPVDKNDPELAREIQVMLQELEACGDPRCTVQPRTKELGDDGVTREETLMAFHRRVTAKYNEMLNLQNMGII